MSFCTVRMSQWFFEEPSRVGVAQFVERGASDVGSLVIIKFP